MSGATGLLERVRAACERDPEAVAFIAGDLQIRYRQLALLWAAAVARLRAQGVTRGQRIAVTFGQSPLQVIAMLALGRIGAWFVPVSPFLQEAMRAQVFSRFALDGLVADRAEYAPPGVRTVLWPELAAALDARALFEGGPWPAAEDTLGLALTSGTTGVPKAILLTHASLAHRAMRNGFQAGCLPRPIPPGLHIPVAQLAAFYALMEGGTVILPGSYDASALLAAARRHEATHLLMPPVTVARLARASNDVLPSLRQLRFLGGTPPRRVVEEARAVLSPHVCAIYATVETTSATFADAEILGREPASAGRPLPDAAVQVVDEAGRLLPAGESGHLRIRVEGMPSSYFGPDEDDRSRFRDGWFYGSDRGHYSPEGLLFVEGRTDEVLNVGGRKVLPPMVEALLESFPGVREAMVFLPEGADRLEAAIVAGPGLDLAALSRHAFEQLELLAPSLYHRVDALPRNSMGKLERSRGG